MIKVLWIALLSATSLQAQPVVSQDPFAQGYIDCSGSTHGQNVELELSITGNEVVANFSLIRLGHPELDWNFTMNPAEIVYANVWYRHVDFAFGHHNTWISLMADGEVFGLRAQAREETSPYAGVLILTTSNAEHPRHQRFDVICQKTGPSKS